MPNDKAAGEKALIFQFSYNFLCSALRPLDPQLVHLQKKNAKNGKQQQKDKYKTSFCSAILYYFYFFEHYYIFLTCVSFFICS